jgi:hypothetical protein
MLLPLPRWRGWARSGLGCTRPSPAARTRCSKLGDATVRPGGPIPAAPEPEPACRRGWGSAYAALARGRIDAEGLRDLLAAALLRCADPRQAEAATWALDQIAKASSSNATANRRIAGSSAASS